MEAGLQADNASVFDPEELKSKIIQTQEKKRIKLKILCIIELIIRR